MNIKISDTDIGKRCDLFVLSYLQDNGFEDITRSFLQNNWDNLVKVNDKYVKPSLKLKEGTSLEINEEMLKEKIKNSIEISTITPQNKKLNVVFENSDFIILNKPSGLVIHPGIRQKENTLANYVVGYLESKGQYDRRLYRGGVVHRLDKGVSGLVLFAKTYESQKFFQKKFENREVAKIYIADVTYKNIPNELKKLFEVKNIDINEALEKLEKDGFLCDSSWYKVEGYIYRSNGNRMKMKFNHENRGKGYRYSLTYIKPLNNHQILVKIETGRMHQIRASLEYLGINIVGDTLYESFSGKGGIPEEISLRAILLSFDDMDSKRRVFRL